MAGSLELPLAFHGHMARLQASPMEGGGWDVHASVDGQDVAHVHCSDWNRVERFRSRMQMRLRSGGVEAIAEWARLLAA
jgi:hypothetical protein